MDNSLAVSQEVRSSNVVMSSATGQELGRTYSATVFMFVPYHKVLKVTDACSLIRSMDD